MSSLPAYILGTSFREACSIIIGEILRRCFHIEHSDVRFCGLKVTRDCSEEREYCINRNHWVLRRSMASSHGPVMVQSCSSHGPIMVYSLYAVLSVGTRYARMLGLIRVFVICICFEDTFSRDLFLSNSLNLTHNVGRRAGGVGGGYTHNIFLISQRKYYWADWAVKPQHKQTNNENICCGTHYKRLGEALVMSTTTYFHRKEISTIFDCKKHLIWSCAYGDVFVKKVFYC